MPDPTEKKHFTMTLDQDIFEQVIQIKRNGGYDSMSAVIRELVRQALASNINWAAVAQARSDAMGAVSRWAYDRLREFFTKTAKELAEVE